MKKLLLSLVVLATIFSCGKNNAVSSSTSATSGLSSSVTGTTEVDLATKINNNSFGTGMADYYETWAVVISKYPNLTYYYSKVTPSTSSNCSTKWGIFVICSNSSSSSSTATISRTVVNSAVDLSAKKSELINIINKRSSISVNNTAYYIYTTDGLYYIIDTAKPLAVNPVQVQQTVNGVNTIEYFNYAK